jgi:hypothetical protein
MRNKGDKMANKIKLIFTANRETFTIEIFNKNIVYKDRKFPPGVQFMPYDKAVRKLIILSRNKIPMWMLSWIEEANQGKNLEEYQSAQTDEDLVPIIKKDAGEKGCVFQKRIDEEVSAEELVKIQEKEKEEAIKLAKDAENTLNSQGNGPTIA